MNDKNFIRVKILKSLQGLLNKCNLRGHELTNFRIFCSMVSSILITGRSELLRIASGQSDRKQHASKVKQYKRWLLNKKTNYKSYFRPYAAALLRHLSTSGLLVFSIDGSVVGKGCMCLMVCVIYKDKAIPIIWKTYKAKKGHLSESKHRALLKALQEIAPSDCRIVMTGDGEFDGCAWQADLKELGWDYVLKTSKNAVICDRNGDVFKSGYALAERGASLFFEDIAFSKKGFRTNLLVWHGRKHKTPLYLLSNLDYTPEIQQLYKKRFKIEPFFRDQKSGGFHIHKSGLRCPDRLDNLLLATCMAYIFCIMSGVKARLSKFYKEFARTDGCFLSLFQVGYKFILFLVDIRQWRAFSLFNDLKPDRQQIPQLDICVPF